MIVFTRPTVSIDDDSSQDSLADGSQLSQRYKAVESLGNLSTDVREPRTATGSGMFPFWRVFAPHNGREKLLLDILWLDITNMMPSKCSKKEKILLLVAVHVSRMSVLKLPTISMLLTNATLPLSNAATLGHLFVVGDVSLGLHLKF